MHTELSSPCAGLIEKDNNDYRKPGIILFACQPSPGLCNQTSLRIRRASDLPALSSNSGCIFVAVTATASAIETFENDSGR